MLLYFFLQHKIQLVGAATRQLLTYLFYQIDDNGFTKTLVCRLMFLLVKCLTAFAKQFAVIAHTIVAIQLHKQDYCLAPGFFRILILSFSSATSMSILMAIFFIFASSNAFSKAFTCFCNA